MSSTLGIDYAGVDGNGPPDFSLARTMGLRWGYIRRSYWNTVGDSHKVTLFKDQHYARDAQRARDAGLVVGAYLFPSFQSNGPTPAEQVAFFAGAGGEILQGVDLPPCLDVEFPGGVGRTGRTRAAVLALVLQFVDAMTKTFGCRPAIYTSHGQWHDTNGLNGPAAPELADTILWLKTAYRLAARNHVDQVAPRKPHAGVDFQDPHDYWRIPAPWQKSGCWMQQFQGDAIGFPGFSRTVDVDLFHQLDASMPGDPRIPWVQKQLKVAEGTPGVLDQATLDALAKFQSDRGLRADGVVGVRTFPALAWE